MMTKQVYYDLFLKEAINYGEIFESDNGKEVRWFCKMCGLDEAGRYNYFDLSKNLANNASNHFARAHSDFYDSLKPKLFLLLRLKIALDS